MIEDQLFYVNNENDTLLIRRRVLNAASTLNFFLHKGVSACFHVIPLKGKIYFITYVCVLFLFIRLFLRLKEPLHM
jgi:hypothetical protein